MEFLFLKCSSKFVNTISHSETSLLTKFYMYQENDAPFMIKNVNFPFFQWTLLRHSKKTLTLIFMRSMVERENLMRLHGGAYPINGPLYTHCIYETWTLLLLHNFLLVIASKFYMYQENNAPFMIKNVNLHFFNGHFWDTLKKHWL